MEKKQILEFFAKKIHEELGIVYNESNFYQLESRLKDIVSQLEYKTIDDFYQVAQKGLFGHARQLLLDIATNNETSFFRDTKVFQAIANVFVKISSEKGRTSPMRIWCAASSTGQEPYSITMMLLDMAHRLPVKDFKIVATDISHRVLEYAKKGVYSQLEVQRGLPAIKLATYFTQGSGDMNKNPLWQLKDTVKNHIEFRSLNLTEPFAGLGTFDIILCRNVLIYQSMQGKKDIVERMSSHLSDQGYLLLGGSESLVGITDHYEISMEDGAVFYRKKGIASRRAG